ncbi:MAG: formylglycine-generating enzyme family protein [Leptospirales bacterium]|nr:formylglycine-generating enzyme family protein [Leptospirales bacterium]
MFDSPAARRAQAFAPQRLTSWLLLVSALLAIGATPALATPQSLDPTAPLPGGRYRSFLAPSEEAPESVAPFRMDLYAVTNQRFADFVARYPQWGPGQPPRIKADAGYLRHWIGGRMSPPQAQLPVVNVSWFAARAYCQAQAKRLPTIAQWELAAAAPDAARRGEGRAALTERILAWYGSPNRLLPVGSVYRNTYGLYDMHGGVWEWTDDFTQAAVQRDSRGENEQNQFCGASAGNASNREDYAAYMRFAMRSSLRAASTAGNLGFRCVATSHLQAR